VGSLREPQHHGPHAEIPHPLTAATALLMVVDGVIVHERYLSVTGPPTDCSSMPTQRKRRGMELPVKESKVFGYSDERSYYATIERSGIFGQWRGCERERAT